MGDNTKLMPHSVFNDVDTHYLEGSDLRHASLQQDSGSDVLPPCKVYKRRWWILAAFCFASLTQSILWNTWSPLLDSLLIAYEWPDSFVALLPGLSNGGYVLLAFPLMYIVEVHDLRLGMIVATSLMVFAASTWNIAFPTGQRWLIAVGSVMDGITACITMAAPPLLSATWFPPSERTTATAFAAMSGYMGTGVAFITSPYISGANVTADEVNHRDTLLPDFINQLKTGVHNVVYFDTGLAAASFLMVMLYFPPKPPLPPSISQTKKRKDFWQGVKHLLTNPHLWLLNVAYNLPNGSFNSWIALCSVNFRPIGVDEATAGWIGFFSLMASVVGSVGMSAVMDRMKRKIKLVCIIMTALAIIVLTLLACIENSYITIANHSTVAVLYVLCVTAGLCINGIVPLYYELGCELAFPVHEGLTCTFLTATTNVVGMFFFLLFQIPLLATDTRWMTWTCAGTCAFTLPLLLVMKERYHRLDVEVNGSIREQTTLRT